MELTICQAARVTVDPNAWAEVHRVELEDVEDDVRRYLHDAARLVSTDILRIEWK